MERQIKVAPPLPGPGRTQKALGGYAVLFNGFRITLGLICLLVTAGLTAGPGSERYILRHAPGAEQSIVAAVTSNRGTVHRKLNNRRLLAVSLPEAATAGLRARKDVDLLEVDPRRYTQADATPYGIAMVQADALTGGLTEKSGHTRKICIMDSGYDLGHEDLPAASVLVTGDDGYPSDCTGPDCNVDSGLWYEDGHGHGTHVSGTILALRNDLGVVGVNPGGTLPVHMVKVFNNQGNWAYGSDLIWALDQCLDAGAQIISMSLGGSGSSEAERDAFEAAYAAGVLPIAAAGNAGNATLSYPASYNAVVSVAAVDSERRLASFSQYNHQVEIAAPGVGVNSTLPGNAYAAWNGTSMATPHVSGVAALVWSHHESCSAAQLRDALMAGAADLGGPGRDSSYGYGLLQAATSEALLAGCDVTPPPPFIAAPLSNDVPENIPLGERGDEFQFTLEVPAGATDLRISTAGGTGDADLYVRHAGHPSADLFDCRPYINGNSETCVEDAPAPGTWHVMVRAYIDFTDVDLIASYIAPDAGSTPQYFAPDAEFPVAGVVAGSFNDLAFNDGLLQTITEEPSGGKPSRRYSMAEHEWRIPDVTGGSSVTLHLVAAGTANTEGDHFVFDVSYDDGASWVDGVLELPQGGALQTYWVPLPATTRGTVRVRARDSDRSPRALDSDVLYLDLMNIVTVPDADDTQPIAPYLSVSPANVKATSVRLDWLDQSDNELGFEIRRWPIMNQTLGDMEVVGVALANATTWLDTAVAPSSSYRYAVAAFTSSYASESNIVDLTTPDGIALQATSAKVQGRIVVNLTWSGATDVVIWRRINGGAWSDLETGYDGTQYEDKTGLKGSPVIDYQVCAADGVCSEVVTVEI